MLRGILLLVSVAFLPACIYVKLAPVEAHVTVDVNVKVNQALNDFFGDLDKKSASLSTDSAKP